jgi:hypothetical protein
VSYIKENTEEFRKLDPFPSSGEELGRFFTLGENVP